MAKFGTEARLDMNRIPYTYMRERITRTGKFCRNGRQDWGVGASKMAKAGQTKNSFPLFYIFYTLFSSRSRFNRSRRQFRPYRRSRPAASPSQRSPATARPGAARPEPAG